MSIAMKTAINDIKARLTSACASLACVQVRVGFQPVAMSLSLSVPVRQAPISAPLGASA